MSSLSSFPTCFTCRTRRQGSKKSRANFDLLETRAATGSRQSPQPQRLILTGRQGEAAVRGEYDCRNRRLVASVDMNRDSAGRVPQVHAPVGPAGDHPLAIGRKIDEVDLSRV